MPQPSLAYLHVRPHEELPPIGASAPFLAVLVVDAACEEYWRWEACRWLAASACRYLLAWGEDCAQWAESAEDAHLEAVPDDVPADQVLLTTSHEEEDLEEVFWFVRHRARHPALQLAQAVIIHVAECGRKEALEALYAQA
jgi:hypothetical protein